jgi:hypothetical protein
MNDPEVNDYRTSRQRLVGVEGHLAGLRVLCGARLADQRVRAAGRIHRGAQAILLTQSESQLASVLAHEISHVTQHHIARMIVGQRDR